MDNLGVLKIIADALNNSTNNSNATQSQQKSSPLDGILQLFNQFKPKNSSEPESQKDQSLDENKKSTLPSNSYTISPPLQRRMLATMTSHEDFIKRVKEKNKTPWLSVQGVI